MWKGLIVLFLMATPAAAGPWLREEGAQFLSFSADSTEGVPGGSLYYERGMTARTMLVVSGSKSRGGELRLIASAVRSLWSGYGWQTATQLGAGIHDGEAAVLTGISAGRGVTIMGHQGWLVGDLQATGTRGAIEARIGGTLGVTLPNGLKIYSDAVVTGDFNHAVGLNGMSRYTSDVTELRGALSAAIPIGQNIWVNVGVSHDFTGDGSTRLNLGLWHEF